MASVEIETTLDAIKAKLDAQLSAKIDAVNAAATDDIVIEYPTAVEVGASHDFVYPYIVVVPEDSTPETDTGAEFVWLHVVRVVSFVAEWDTGKLVRRLVRMQRAVREVCLSQRQPGVAIGDGGWGIRLLRSEYGPVFQPDPNEEFVQGIASLFEVRQGQVV